MVEGQPSSAPAFRPGNRLTWAIALLLIAVYAALSVGVALELDRVVDELKYFRAGSLAWSASWDHPGVYQHGPLFYLAAQVFVPEVLDPRDPDPGTFLLGRLGTLPFGILAGLLVFAWSRRVFGNAGGLFSLALYALNPLVIGYSGLVLVEIAHGAAVLLVVYVLWRYLERLSWGLALLLGLALGISFATKYLALLIAPPVALIAALRTWWCNGLSKALGVLMAVVLVSVATLYACYGFTVGRAERDSELYRSEAVSSLVGTPLVGDLLTLLPRPFLLGLDFQKKKAEGTRMVFLNGTWALGHWDYFLWSFLTKSPELLIALTVWLLLLRVPPWVRGRGPFEERSLVWATLPIMAVVLLYLSFFTTLQFGIRYALQLYPLLFVLLGAFGKMLVGRDASGKGVLVALVLLVGFHARDLYGSWPNLIGYYNPSSGGQAAAYRHFRDANSDYGQYRKRGLEILRAQETEPFQVLAFGSGPRFGRLAANLQTLDRLEDGHPRFDWLEPVQPVQHVAACWWLFDVTPAAFESAVDADPALRQDLIVAYLGAGDLESARRHLGELPQDEAGPLRRLRRLLVSSAAPEAGRETLEKLITAWREQGRADRVLALLDERSELWDADELVYARARALADEGLVQDALEVLEAEETLPRSATLLMVQLYARQVRYDEAIAILERFDPEGEDPAIQDVLANVRAQAEKLRRFEEPQ